MKKGIIYHAISRWKITVSAIILIAILGGYSFFIIPKQESPIVTSMVAIISCVYPGASTEDVEKMVTEKIEDNIQDISGYDFSHSTSKNNLSIVILWLKNEADKDKSWNELRQNMDDVQRILPKECSPIEINTDVTDTAGMFISISGEKYSNESLLYFAEEYKEKLQTVEGISRFEIIGESKKNVEIIVDAQKLNFYQLSLEEVVQILSVQNIQIPSGAIINDEIKINVNTPSMYTSLMDIEDIIIDISKDSGAIVRLKDIASVQWGVPDDNIIIRSNGTNAILLVGYFEENKNAISIGKEINKEIEQIERTSPEDLNIDILLDQPKEISQSVNRFIRNLLSGIALVILVVFVGMSLRNAIVVSTVIPLSIFMTFILMYIFNVQIHEISTAGLIIALGMLVDNAIVVSDSIQIKIDNKMDRLKACIKGAKDSAIPILTATLTTVAAFLPLLLLGGSAGQFIFSIPFTVIVSLAASYMNAMLVIPILAYFFFTETKESKKLKTSRVRSFFSFMLEKGLKRKKLFIGSSFILLAVSVLLVIKMGVSFFPHADKDIIYIDITTETSSSLSHTEKLVDKIENILSDQPEITNYMTSIGDGLPKFYITLFKGLPSQDYAQTMMRVDLEKGKRFKENSEFVTYLQKIFDSSFSEGKAIIKQLELAEPKEAPIKIRITGENIEKNEKISNDIMHFIKNMDGTMNIRNDLPSLMYEYEVKINRDKASYIGISNYDIQKQVNIALKGAEASVFKKDGDEYNILVKTNIDSIENLKNLAIKSSATKEKIILKQIAEIDLVAKRPIINRYENQRSVSVLTDVMPNYSAVNIENKIEKELISTIDSNGATISFDGEREAIIKYFGSALQYAVLAIIIIYFILLIQFYSFTQPFIILFTVVLAVIGSIFGLFITSQSLSFTAFLGIISLMGIIVNNAILLIEYANSISSNMESAEEIVRGAVERRFRPIILSTITTVFGLVPLAFSKSALFVPMAIALISGLIIATFLTLVIIPIIYVIIVEHKHDYPFKRRVKE